jgi:predicted ATPase
MLTRLHVSGFKNLVDTEVRFGPLTCIAGPNGVGKSNVFDAIRFLSRLADKPFLEAATATRGGEDVTELFTAGGGGRMRFECDLLIPSTGVDDFEQPAEASETFLAYSLELRLDLASNGLPRVRLEHERLAPVPRDNVRDQLGFDCAKSWRDSVVRGSGRHAPFIDMGGEGDQRAVRLRADRGRDSESERGASFLARGTPRTILSAAQNADEARTAVLARAEMRAWRILQLEPSALRRPDELQAPSALGSHGEHLPATLYRLASLSDASRVYAEVANRLAEVVADVRSLRVDRDDTRSILRVLMTDRRGVELPASSLSDGTLRFVALSVLEQDPAAIGLICLEEPENGIHPERMDAMMQLLADMAVDVQEPVGPDNPLRQVIVNTQSPVAAARAKKEDLIFASLRDAPGAPPGRLRSLILRAAHGRSRIPPVLFRPRSGPSRVTPMGTIFKYLTDEALARSAESGPCPGCSADAPVFRIEAAPHQEEWTGSDPMVETLCAQCLRSTPLRRLEPRDPSLERDPDGVIS